MIILYWNTSLHINFYANQCTLKQLDAPLRCMLTAQYLSKPKLNQDCLHDNTDKLSGLHLPCCIPET